MRISVKREPSKNGTDGSDPWPESPPDLRQSRNQKGVHSSLHGEEKAKMLFYANGGSEGAATTRQGWNSPC